MGLFRPSSSTQSDADVQRQQQHEESISVAHRFLAGNAERLRLIEVRLQAESRHMPESR